MSVRGGDTSITERIAAMRTDAEEWKSKQRHEDRQSTVLDATVDVRSTSNGHKVRTVRKNNQKDGEVEYAEPMLPTGSSAVQGGGGAVTYVDVLPGGRGNGTGKADDESSSDEDLEGADPTLLYVSATAREATAGGDASSASDVDAEAEAKLLYDNEDYTGRHPKLPHKRKGVRKQKRHGVAGEVASANGAGAGAGVGAGQHALPVPLQGNDEDGSSDTDVDEDEDAEAKLLYDNEDYTGRHPNLTGRAGVRRKGGNK